MSVVPPKPAVSHGPQSPFAAELSRSQLGIALKRSVTLGPNVTFLATLVTRATAEWILSAVLRPSCDTPRAALALSAVLPLPKRSYDTPMRGLISFQRTTSIPLKGRLRAGAY